MNDIAPVLEQARLFLTQNLPSQVPTGAIGVAIVCLIAGIGLSVLGAKFARIGLTVAFVLLGAAGAYQFSQIVGLPSAICMPVGAAMTGVIGHLTYRLWAGMAVALVLSALVLGAFGYQRVVPHVAEFEETQMVVWSPVDGTTPISLPTPDQQQAFGERSANEWARELWSFVAAKDLNAERAGISLAVVTLLGGLFLGVIAVRWAMILATSLAGTMLVTTGVATLFTHFSPGSYQAFFNHPGVTGMVCGAFLVASFALQTMLTRKPVPAEESKRKIDKS